MPRIRNASLATLLLIFAGCSNSGGSGLPVPTEPLEIGGTSRPSARDYYAFGESVLETRPGLAADAFYWASRRDPTWAAPLAGRRLALFLSDRGLYRLYLSGSQRSLEHPKVQQLDSMYLRALKLNPFLDRGLEATAVKAQWKESIRRSVRRRNPGTYIDDATLSEALADMLQEADYETRGWLAHCEGRYLDAIRYYELALEGSHRTAELHADLARVLIMVGRHTEAVGHMEAGVANLRAREDDQLVRVYSSKALYLHTIGLIEENRGATRAARAAYAEALQEDLSYHPAHVRLAELALASGDTTTALSEMRLAADIAPDDALVLLSYGRLLQATNDLPGAEAAFQHLTAVEPWFPTGHHELALLLDSQGRAAEAAAAYRAFLDRAPANAPGVLEAEERLRALPEPAAEGGEGSGAKTGGVE